MLEIQVGPLDIFDKRQFQQLVISNAPNDGGKLVQTRSNSRT